ncbi:MAG: homocysteine S-methyltransferase family protein [Pseudomonadota bacterium]
MSQVVLLDGGMGQELIRRGGQPATPLWATQLLIDSPGLVAQVHEAYADAGATVATTNTYAIHRDRLRGSDSNHYAADGVDMANIEDQFEQLLLAAVAEADPVRDRSQVAGSIGPLGASYRPDLHPDQKRAVDLFSEIAGILAPTVDILLFETIPSIEAARHSLAAGRRTDRPVWLSFTANDEDGSRLRSGEPVAEAARIAAEADAALINCSRPEAIPAALEAISGAGVPFGAYGNGFTKIAQEFIDGGSTATSLEAREDLGPDAYADHALAWVEQGASIVGGCCEVGPEHISRLRDRLVEAGHEITRRLG